MAKLHHPQAPASLTIAGETYTTDAGGFVEIPDHLTDHAFAHGFTDEAPARLEKPAKAATLKK